MTPFAPIQPYRSLGNSLRILGSHCLVYIRVWNIFPIIAHSEMEYSELLTSREVIALSILEFGGLPYNSIPQPPVLPPSPNPPSTGGLRDWWIGGLDEEHPQSPSTTPSPRGHHPIPQSPSTTLRGNADWGMYPYSATWRANHTIPHSSRRGIGLHRFPACMVPVSIEAGECAL